MIRSKYLNKILTFFDDKTHERVGVMAPYHFKDDFDGYELLETEAGSKGRWATVQVNLNTAIGLAADEPCGAAHMQLDADSNAEDAVLYWGDQRAVSVKYGAVIEIIVDVSVLPTGAVCAVWGLAGDHNLDKDTVAESAWFRLEGSGALKVETDDTTNNNDDVATGITLTAGVKHIFRIDFTDLTDVKFYADGVRVAAGTTFDMSNLSDAEAVMQPYVSLDKGIATTVGSLKVDKVDIWTKRAA